MRHSLLAATITVALVQAPLATAASAEKCDAVEDRERAECVDAEQAVSGEKGGVAKWAIGGGILAALGVAAGSGGGGSGSDSKPPSGGGNPPSGGGGTPPPQSIGEGAANGGNGVLVASGHKAEWSQGADTRINRENARNDGDLVLTKGSLSIVGEGELRNNGRIEMRVGTSLALSGDGDLDNHGTFVSSGAAIDLSGESSIDNYGSMMFADTTVSLKGDAEFDNGGNTAGRGHLSMVNSQFVLSDMAEFENYGTIEAKHTGRGGALVEIISQRLPGEDDPFIEAFDNHGTVRMDGNASLVLLQADSYATRGFNRRNGLMYSNAQGLPAVRVIGPSAAFVNEGTITVTGDNAVAMDGARGATLINEGTINLGLQGVANGAGLVAMQSDGSAVLENSGTINIYADSSYAFRVNGTGNGRLINNGRVNVYGTGSAIDAPAALGHYTIGTNADGSAGQMVFERSGELADVDISTHFTAGTAETSVHFDDVFVGAVEGEENIRSQSVVWEAEALRDEDGNIDVVMTKRNYVDFAEGHLADLAGALDNGYTNSALFRSLELASAGEVQSALSQLSGKGISTGAHTAFGNAHAFRTSLDARQSTAGIQSVSYAAGLREGWGPKGSGQAMVMIVPGQSGTWDTKAGVFHDQLQGTRDSQQVGLLALGWTKALGNYQWRQSVNSEWHALNSARTLEYGSTRQHARSQQSLTRQSVDSTLTRSLVIGRANIAPRLGVSAYAYEQAAFRERDSAFGLSVEAGDGTGVNLESGIGWSWAAGANWRFSGDAMFIKPLALRESERRASFLNARDVSFAMPGMQADEWGHRLALGMDHWNGPARLNINVRSQRWFGQQDYSAEMNWARAF